MKNTHQLFLKKIFGISILIFAFKGSDAQIISNGNFETVQNTPHYQQRSNLPNQASYWEATKFATGWTSPTGGSPDLFNDGVFSNAACGSVGNISDNPGRPAFNTHPAMPPLCCYPQVCTSTNLWGSDVPRAHVNDPIWQNDANHQFVGLAMPAEYLQTPQFTQLTPGVTYQLSFWLSRADLADKAVRMQVLFSNVSCATQATGIMDYSSDPFAYVLTARHFMYDKTGWTQVTFSFTATGHERYMTFGIFDVNGTFNPVTQLTEPTFEVDYLTPGDCQSGNGPNGCGPIMPNPGLTWTDQNGTHQLNCATDNISHCQAADTYYYIDDVSLVATCTGFTTPLSLVNATLTTNYSNANILLTGNIVINGNVTFTGCTIRCNPGTSIHLINSSTVHFVNSITSGGCNNQMWYGVYTDNLCAVYVNGSSISDAITAIDCKFSYLQIDNSTFSKNVTDIFWHNPQTLTSQHILGTTFDHLAPLIDSSQGIGGYGIKSIEYDMAPVGFTPTIGGIGSGQTCFFKGGQWGVQVSDGDLTLKGCFFQSIAQEAVNFVGNNPNNAFRTLSVISCTFVTCKKSILSHHRTNLTVQSSSLNDAQEHCIEWSDNHDGTLIVGDTTNAALGNLFQNNAWAAVLAWDNRTSQTNAVTLATNNSGNNVYTTIVIGNNHVIAPYAAGGFLIGEWAAGQYVTYHILNVVSNVMDNVVKGVQLYNVKGWYDAGLPGNFGTPPSNRIFGNMCNTQTVVAANAFGFKVGNSMGMDVSQNGVLSDNAGNYLNSGLVFENDESTNIYGNIVSAGTAISCGLDMLNSKVHCNWMVSYAVGISLGWTYLRSAQNDLHGSSLEEYNNLINGGIPWNSDINVYNSYKDHNQWVWNNAPAFCTITYSGNTGSGNTIISTTQGVDKCLGPLGVTVFDNGTNPQLSFPNDANAQWRADYSYEIKRLSTGVGDATVASANIKSIIGIENNIGLGHYTDALTALAALTPSNTVEQNYKDVLTIFASINNANREPTENEVAALTTVAAKFARTDGAAVTLARAYLAAKFNLYFDDEHFATGEVSGVASITTPCSLEPAAKTSLGFIDPQGLDVGITGTTVEADGSFTFDPFQLAYYSQLYPDSTFRIYSKYGSKFTVVNKEFKTLADWISLSPLTLSMSGVTVQVDTITGTEYDPIDSATSITDGDGNTYSVGTIAAVKSNDMLIEKRSSKGDLIWSRTYAGPVEGNDTATCITMDQSGFIYVGGKVWNGRSFDIQALKYDADGYLQWTSAPTDFNASNNHPTGITVEVDANTVSVSSIRPIGNGNVNYRYVTWEQCLPSANRLGQLHEEQPLSTDYNAIDFYPNPSNGKLTIALKDYSGGLLEMYNLEGQLVFSQQVTQSGEIELPENQVPNGLYLLKFTGAGVSQINKLVIHRN